MEATVTGAARDELDEVRMTFGEHLEELRWRLIKCVLAWAACFLVAIWFYEPLVDFMIRPHYQAMEWLKVPEASRKLQIQAYHKPIWAVLKLAFIVSLFAASPVVMFQIWRFVAAGLYKHERKYVLRYSLPSLLLFLGGCVFGYVVLIPYGLFAMATMMKFDFAIQQYIMQDYLDLVMVLTIVTGVTFELPLVMMFVTSIGLASPKLWWSWSRYSIVGIFLASAILTPSPDVFTQVLMAGPLTILYFIGLGLSWFVVRKPEAKLDAPPAGR